MVGRESYAASGWSVRFHVPGINAQARRKMEGTSFTKSGTYSTHPPQTGQTYVPFSTYETEDQPCGTIPIPAPLPLRHPRLLPLLSSSTLVIEDPGFFFFSIRPPATSRRLRAWLRRSPEPYMGARTV